MVINPFLHLVWAGLDRPFWQMTVQFYVFGPSIFTQDRRFDTWSVTNLKIGSNPSSKFIKGDILTDSMSHWHWRKTRDCRKNLKWKLVSLLKGGWSQKFWTLDLELNQGTRSFWLSVFWSSFKLEILKPTLNR